MTTSEAERAAMRRALELAVTPGVPLGPNPRVGCVLLDPDGTVVAEGHHRGAGTPHAEAAALTEAGAAAVGTTAVVTLEPCNHTGRTGPCAPALVEAGVRRVIVAQRDPNPVAAGGLETLAAAGVETDAGHLRDIGIHALRSAVAEARRTRNDAVAAVGITSMGESGVLVDAQGEPVAPVVAWHDARDAAEVAELADVLGADEFGRVAGKPLRGQWSLTKHLWLRRHHEPTGRAGVPERGGLVVAARRARRKLRSLGHASATPRINVALMWRVDRAPPVPWARARRSCSTRRDLPAGCGHNRCPGSRS